MGKLRPLNWSQRVTMRMLANGRSPAGGTGFLDTRGMGIPGGTIRSLRQRGLIEPYSWFHPGWALTKAGVESLRNGECDEEGDAPIAPTGGCSQPGCAGPVTRQTYADRFNLTDPWASENYVLWCTEHAPLNSWPALDSCTRAV